MTLPDHWDGFTERRHDEKCQVHSREVKEWVSDKICIATKGTKVKQAIMWTAMSLILASSGTLAWKAITIAGDQKTIDTQQTSDIQHNREKINAVIEAQGKIVESQEEMQDKIENINIKQTRIITILERIEKKVDD